MLETPTMLNTVISGANYCFTDTGTTTIGLGTINPMESLEVGKMENNTRVIRIFIADADTNVDINDRILYQGKEIVTELTDQELFFELNITDILNSHNMDRVKMLNKDLSDSTGRDVYLKKIKIRDLVMTVVNIASF